ncbi:hypothetical protein CLV00_1360 [Flavobacterium sp. 11]|nr:hypothetical protein CLV00_1360 [Flavobacterium sp. 11]
MFIGLITYNLSTHSWLALHDKSDTLLVIQIYNNYLINYQSNFILLKTSSRVKDGSGNPFMKRSAIKDYNGQPDPKLRGGTTSNLQGHAQIIFLFRPVILSNNSLKFNPVPSRSFGIRIVNKKLVWVAKIL